MCYMSAKSDTVGVRELRQNLSVYLRRVKKGERLQVTERGQLVAVLAPPEAKMSKIDQLIAAGMAQPAKNPHGKLPPPLRLSPEETARVRREFEDSREERLP